MIKLSHVSKYYDKSQQAVVNDLSLEIRSGETLVLLGSSGCGKTTTMKMINRLIKPSNGTIELDGTNINDIDPVELRRSIGYVFQGIGLFPHMTVAENVAIVLRLLGVPEATRNQNAKELLEFVNLSPDKFADRLPSELSGGQQQRVGVARALANKPEYLLMDEPFGKLDSINRDALQEDFIKLKNQLNKTVVFVTHDIIEALRLADRIAVMDKGQLVQVGSNEEIVNNPANDFVRDLFAKPAEQFSSLTEQLAE